MLIGFRAIPVFGYSQTEGEPLPWAEEERRFFDARDAEATGHGAFTHKGAQAIAISVGTDSLMTWAHELVHVTNHHFGTLTLAPGQ